jgi:protein SCO1/2
MERTPAPAQFDVVDLPNVPLRTQQGHPVRFYDDLVKGKTVLVNFMFTSCATQCPQTMTNLAKVQQALGAHAGRDVFLISISIDPAHDVPATLASYAERYEAGPGWTLATGSQADIDSIQENLGLSPRDGRLHTGMAVYGNEIRRRWTSTPIMQNPATLARLVLELTVCG